MGLAKLMKGWVIEKKIVGGKQVRLSEGHVRGLLIIGEPLPVKSSKEENAQPLRRLENQQGAKRTLYLGPSGTVGTAAAVKNPK